jgi:hypothetical protein
MDCPHCQTENLVGATRCASCGESMITRNRFGPPAQVAPVVSAATKAPAAAVAPRAPSHHASTHAPPHTPQPVSAAPSAPEQALCRICRTPCDIAPGVAAPQAICISCKILSEMNAAAASDAAVRPETAAEADAEFAVKLGSGETRPRIKGARRKELRAGPVAVVAAVALSLVCIAVVKVVDRKPDVAGKLLGDVRAEPATFVVAPDEQRTVAWDTTLRLRAMRDEVRASFADPRTTLDLTQVTVQICEAAFVRHAGDARVLDVTAACSVREQTGRRGADDAAGLEIYAFRGHSGKARLVVAPGAPTAPLADADILAGRDIPPFLTIADLGLAAQRAAPGDRWKAPLRLTILCDGDGLLYTADFPADIAYAGRAARRGVQCAAFRIDARLPSVLPSHLADSMNAREGDVAGAVFFDLATGLIHDAALEFDTRLRREGSRTEDDLRVSGRYEVRRR